MFLVSEVTYRVSLKTGGSKLNLQCREGEVMANERRPVKNFSLDPLNLTLTPLWKYTEHTENKN